MIKPKFDNCIFYIKKYIFNIFILAIKSINKILYIIPPKKQYIYFKKPKNWLNRNK